MSDAKFYDRINTIYQIITDFLDKKCLFLRNMQPWTDINVSLRWRFRGTSESKRDQVSHFWETRKTLDWILTSPANPIWIRLCISETRVWRVKGNYLVLGRTGSSDKEHFRINMINLSWLEHRLAVYHWCKLAPENKLVYTAVVGDCLKGLRTSPAQILLLLPGKGPRSSPNVIGPAGLVMAGKNSKVPKALIKTG